MFSGIIKEIGRTTSVVSEDSGLQITIEAPASARELAVSDSVAVNGVCQTVVRKRGSRFVVQAVEETLKKTTLGRLRDGSSVNIELALRLNERVGGHLVQGHVDGVGFIRSVDRKPASWVVSIEIPEDFARYVIPVGSLAVDGVSLTVASVHGRLVGVSLIPYTLEHTTLGEAKPGNQVNLEFDMIGKYVESLLSHGRKGEVSALNMDLLRQWGYDV
jgi:riboflavin synthase